MRWACQLHWSSFYFYERNKVFFSQILKWNGWVWKRVFIFSSFPLQQFLNILFSLSIDSIFIFFSYMRFIYLTLFLLWNKILQCVITRCWASCCYFLSSLVEINIEPNHNKELQMKWWDEEIKFRKKIPLEQVICFFSGKEK